MRNVVFEVASSLDNLEQARPLEHGCVYGNDRVAH